MVLLRGDIIILHYYYYQVYGIGPQRIDTEGITCSKVFPQRIVVKEWDKFNRKMTRVTPCSWSTFIQLIFTARLLNHNSTEQLTSSIVLA